MGRNLRQYRLCIVGSHRSRSFVNNAISSFLGQKRRGISKRSWCRCRNSCYKAGTGIAVLQHAVTGPSLWERWEILSGHNCLFRDSAYVTKTVIIQHAGLPALVNPGRSLPPSAGWMRVAFPHGYFPSMDGRMHQWNATCVEQNPV